jgi:hypothetical protein
LRYEKQLELAEGKPALSVIISKRGICQRTHLREDGGQMVAG